MFYGKVDLSDLTSLCTSPVWSVHLILCTWVWQTYRKTPFHAYDLWQSWLECCNKFMYVPSVVRTSYTVYVSVRNIHKNAISYTYSMAKLIGMLEQVYVRLQCGLYILNIIRECDKQTSLWAFQRVSYECSICFLQTICTYPKTRFTVGITVWHTVSLKFLYWALVV